jgi:hypothetical protein
MTNDQWQMKNDKLHARNQSAKPSFLVGHFSALRVYAVKALLVAAGLHRTTKPKIFCRLERIFFRVSLGAHASRDDLRVLRVSALSFLATFVGVRHLYGGMCG